MAELNTAVLVQNLTITQTLDTTAAPGTSSQLIHSAFNKTRTGNASTNPPVTKSVVTEITLAGGTYTLDLTAAPKTNGGTQDLTGLKVRQAYFRYNEANVAAVNIAPGGSPYPLVGAANDFTLPLKGGATFDLQDGAPAVAGGVKEITFTGTTGDKVQVALALG